MRAICVDDEKLITDYNGITDIWNDLKRDPEKPLIIKYPDLDVVRDFLITMKKDNTNVKEQNED